MDAQTAGRTGATGGSGATIGPAGRPTALLPLSHLVRISAYWLGLTAIDGAVGRYVQERLTFGDLVAPTGIGEATALITAGGTIVAVLVQPTVGTISDYTVSRFGRRKPYIIVGSILDVAFLAGLRPVGLRANLAVFIDRCRNARQVKASRHDSSQRRQLRLPRPLKSADVLLHCRVMYAEAARDFTLRYSFDM